jgi:hypothetical protein
MNRLPLPEKRPTLENCVLSRQFVFLTIAVAIGALLLAGCGSRTATLAEGPGTVVTPTAAVNTTTSDRAIPPADVSPQATVRAWMAALARGGSDAAWDLLTQATKDGLGRAAFEQMLPGLTETWGSWAASDAVEVHAHAYAPGPSVDYFGIPYYVVTVVGTPAGEGSRDRRARSIVVGWRGGPNWRGASDYGIVIPPSKPTGAFRLLSPAADGEEVSQLVPLRVALPIDSELALWLDDLSVGSGAMNVGPKAYTVWTCEPKPRPSPGEHVVTAAWFRVSAVYGPPGANVLMATTAVVFNVK